MNTTNRTLTKRLLTLLTLLCFTVMQTAAQPRISIFFDHVADIARQEKISINEAAKRVRQLGYEGIDVRVEDYDNPRSPCFNTLTLDHLFTASPQLNHVFDTGNYLFCGEDVMTALRHFRERTHHVHLKDRKAMKDYASLPVGTGIVPLKEVVCELLHNGYDGWFTVEHFGASPMLEYARQSIANVKAAWDECQ